MISEYYILRNDAVCIEVYPFLQWNCCVLCIYPEEAGSSKTLVDIYKATRHQSQKTGGSQLVIIYVRTSRFTINSQAASYTKMFRLGRSNVGLSQCEYVYLPCRMSRASELCCRLLRCFWYSLFCANNASADWTRDLKSWLSSLDCCLKKQKLKLANAFYPVILSRYCPSESSDLI
jgi:hypothetical protein